MRGIQSRFTTIRRLLYNFCQINDNDIYVPINGGRGVYAKNTYYIHFNENRFYLANGTMGILVQNFFDPGGNPGPTDIYFSNNIFTGGYISLFIGGYASVNMPVLVEHNVFNNANWSLVGRMLTGSIKNNITNSNSNYYATGLWQGNPNLYNNTITNQSGPTINLNSAYPQMAPTINNENDLLWFGGNNHITAVGGDNIHFYSSKATLDLGNNCFSISNPNYYHLYGHISTTESQYSSNTMDG